MRKHNQMVIDERLINSNDQHWALMPSGSFHSRFPTPRQKQNHSSQLNLIVHFSDREQTAGARGY